MALAARLGDSGEIRDRKPHPWHDTDRLASIVSEGLATRRRRAGDVPFARRGSDLACRCSARSSTTVRRKRRVCVRGIASSQSKANRSNNGRIGSTYCAPPRVNRLTVELERDGVRERVTLTPAERIAADGSPYGYIGVSPLMREVKYGVLAALPMSLHETASKTRMTFDLMVKMVTGLVSTRNLSGPITIAKVAGDSARSGWGDFLRVLALLSISLGVLNLLPIPILDGGHVMFCLAEIVIRRPVPDRVQAWGMQLGLAIVGGMMLLAFYNDITRLF